jgi:Secretion system C-terminal sorting domain
MNKKMSKPFETIITVSFFLLVFISGSIFAQQIDKNPGVFLKFKTPLEKQIYSGVEIPAPPLSYNMTDLPVPYLNVNISQNPAPQNEPAVRISRTNPNRVVAAWRDFRYGIDPVANRRVGYSYSGDGGTTWSTPRLLDSTLLGNNLFKNSDPVVTSDASGFFYISVIAINSVNGSLTLAVYRSVDGGVTFPNAYIAAAVADEDKEWIICDLSPASPYNNTLYITWTRFSSTVDIKLTKSTNAGVNWTNAVTISDPNHSGQGSNSCTSPNGQINVVWAGGTFSTTDIVYDKSTDGGNTFGTDSVIASGLDPQGLPNNVGTFPSIACDLSGGPRHGYLYVVFCDGRNGDADVFFIRSTDNGIEWSAPVRVNDDSLGNGKIQYWPWISVNDSGKIAILFMDSRNTTSNSIIEAYLARSTDGGLSFTNELLSSQPSPTQIPGSNVRFGDYICVDYYKNRIVPVWTDERAGGFNMEIYTAVINDLIGIKQISGIVPDNYKLYQNYPNPFNPTTNIKFDIPKSSLVKVVVYDILGREVKTLVNEFKNAGSYKLDFDASNISSGTYFYRIEAGDFVEIKKMVLIK